MVRADLLVKTEGGRGESPSQGDVEEVLDALLQGALVTLETQHTIAPLGTNLVGNGTLAAHRVESDDTAIELEELRQLEDRGDLVGFLRGALLPQHLAVAAHPGAHPLQWRTPPAAITRAAVAFAVHGADLANRGARHRLGPAANTRPKALGREAREDVGNAVMRGHPVRKPCKPA